MRSDLRINRAQNTKGCDLNITVIPEVDNENRARRTAESLSVANIAVEEVKRRQEQKSTTTG